MGYSPAQLQMIPSPSRRSVLQNVLAFLAVAGAMLIYGPYRECDVTPGNDRSCLAQDVENSRGIMTSPEVTVYPETHYLLPWEVPQVRVVPPSRYGIYERAGQAARGADWLDKYMEDGGRQYAWRLSWHRLSRQYLGLGVLAVAAWFALRRHAPREGQD